MCFLHYVSLTDSPMSEFSHGFVKELAGKKENVKWIFHRICTYFSVWAEFSFLSTLNTAHSFSCARRCFSIMFPWIITLVLTRHCYWFLCSIVWSSRTAPLSLYPFPQPTYMFCSIVHVPMPNKHMSQRSPYKCTYMACRCIIMKTTRTACLKTWFVVIFFFSFSHQIHACVSHNSCRGLIELLNEKGKGKVTHPCQGAHPCIQDCTHL